MHHSFELSIEGISKVEGHASLSIKVVNNKVEKARLQVSENKRFFEEASIGKHFQQIPSLYSRICGTCSAAHLLCSIEAIEKALSFTPSSQTMQLRKLLLNGSIIRDHGMHLYYFCLPDVFEKESILDFEGSLEHWVHDSMHVRDAGVKLAELVGGRSIHPTTPLIGGFAKIPEKEKIREIVKQLHGERGRVLKLIECFFEWTPKFERKTNYIALQTGDYSFLEGRIVNSSGEVIEEKDFEKHLEEFILPYSTAGFFKFEGREFMVGALARINLNKQELHSQTKKDCQKFLKIFPCNDCFNNNTAQAIEILHCIDSSIETLESLKLKQEALPSLTPIESKGIGVVEAPRGTLYHSLTLGKNGKITNSDIVIPTAQNAINIEKDIASFVQQLLETGKLKEQIALEIEKLIRAYDPCFSCATHFLKVNWE